MEPMIGPGSHLWGSAGVRDGGVDIGVDLDTVDVDDAVGSAL